jgi:hypothetical protein
MWVFTIHGFYSAVENRDDPTTMLVRCRDREDAQRLADWLGEDDLPIEVRHTPDADYAYRMVVPRLLFGNYLMSAVMDIDYTNFKSAVAERQGHDRADIYLDVWQVMLDLQKAGE